MLHYNAKYLQFFCSSYSLMLPLTDIAEITFYDETLCAPSGNSLLHHGKTTLWRNTVLPYIDLRLALHLPEESLAQPSNTLVLCDTKSAQAIAVIAVDGVTGFVTPQAHEWYNINGINRKIDIFFDRLYAEKQSGMLTMCLRSPSQWLHQAIPNPANGIHHAH